MKRRLIPAVILLVLFCGLFFATYRQSYRASRQGVFSSVGSLEQGPPFSLPLMPDGRSFLNLKDWQAGRPVLLVFWATWCPPCLQEIPTLESWQEKYKGRFKILAVHVGEPKEPLEVFMANRGITYPVVLDRDSRAAELYGVSGLPVSVMLDPDGKILYYGFSLPHPEEVLTAAGL